MTAAPWSTTGKESEAFDICEKKIADHGLEMKLVNVSASFDGNKIIFLFHRRRTGGLPGAGAGPGQRVPGPHRAAADRRPGRGQDDRRPGHLRAALLLLPVPGRLLPVSIKMAKTQNLSLNPTKISGTCGRLMLLPEV